jgi:hypothetical protein
VNVSVLWLNTPTDKQPTEVKPVGQSRESEPAVGRAPASEAVDGIILVFIKDLD